MACRAATMYEFRQVPQLNIVPPIVAIRPLGSRESPIRRFLSRYRTTLGWFADSSYWRPIDGSEPLGYTEIHQETVLGTRTDDPSIRPPVRDTHQTGSSSIQPRFKSSAWTSSF